MKIIEHTRFVGPPDYIIEFNDGVLVRHRTEDEILQLYDESGELAAKIIQRRVEKARSDENRKNND